MNDLLENKKFHILYKTTRNDGSNKYYIGIHSTDNLDDGYLGSGTILTSSVLKYGKALHTKEILFFLSTRKELLEKEKSIVTEELLNDPFCMNLTIGGNSGHGKKIIDRVKKGWSNQEKRDQVSKKSKENWMNPEFRQKVIESQKIAFSNPAVKRKISESSKKNWENPKYRENRKSKMQKIYDETDYKSNMSDKMKEKWKDIVYQEKISSSQRDSWQKDNSSNRRDNFLKNMSTPECCQKRNESIKRNKQMKKAERVKNQIILVDEANIDFSKEGWASKVKKIIKSGHVYQWMKEHKPEIFYNVCWFRFPNLVK